MYDLNDMQVIYDADDANSLIFPSNDVLHHNDVLSPAAHDTYAEGLKTVVYNPYPCFGGPRNVWPRGYPLDAVKDSNLTDCQLVAATSTTDETFNQRRPLGVVQIVANHDPDVDALYRLTSLPEQRSLNFELSTTAQGASRLEVVPPTAFTPYNAQVNGINHRKTK